VSWDSDDRSQMCCGQRCALSWVLSPLLSWLTVSCEDVTEAVEAAFPERPPLPNPLVGDAQTVGVEVASADPTVLLGAYEAAALQNLKVLHDGRERHVERSGEISGRARRDAEPLHDGAARRIPEGVEDLADARMVKHRL
jgi:hypothetical protein